MREFDLLSSLVDIWVYSSHIIDKERLPEGYPSGYNSFLHGQIERHIYPWDLDILSREIILNAGVVGNRRLQIWDNLATAINFIRDMDNKSYSEDGDDRPDVLFELHRIAHRQFPWQVRNDLGGFVRALNIFGEPTVDRIVERELGLSTQRYLLLGMAIAGHFKNKWGMSTEQDYREIGVSLDASRAFFTRLVSPISRLREEMRKRQAYNRDWMYTWNPLEGTPLVAFDPRYPERIVCPIQRYLLRRVSTGLFYDLVKASDFDNSFGNAFQAYIGLVARQFCKEPSFRLLDPPPYRIGSRKMHGVDWILSDGAGHLFIECKAKRLTLNARTLSEPSALERDLSIMADGIVQNYKNIMDARNGLTVWEADSLPIYPLILTLEDWFIFSPRVREMLDAQIYDLLDAEGIPVEVLDTMPYTVASAHEFEIVVQLISQVGVGSLMGKKVMGAKNSWSMLPYLMDEFKAEMPKVNRRFQLNEFRRIVRDVPGI